MKPDPYSPDHRHKYSSWSLKRCSINPKPELTDKEYISGLRFPPMWEQECACGFNHFIRWPQKPKATLKYKEVRGARLLG